ncbi:MAG: 5-formyltetrahydrofolate cyclo-ligase [Victivallaceae bacterium]|nr:5-formyltetrahydrofolate cyclo-ligase [Victivallaceae bacterium]MDD5663839.1 5-formyltetrahydrofolate cyclo-ligase [Victivallaceae bacterium]
MTEKAEMRRKMLKLRSGLSSEFRTHADAAINAALREIPQLKSAAQVGVYWSDGTEPSLDATLTFCLNNGQKVYAPRGCRDNGAEYEMVEIRDPAQDMVKGRYGLMEPKNNLPMAPAAQRKSMVWLIPGVAFDGYGHRLGRGKGIYDRLLNGETGCKIGIFYGFQEVSAVPVCHHDECLDIAVTENGVIQFNI